MRFTSPVIVGLRPELSFVESQVNLVADIKHNGRKEKVSEVKTPAQKLGREQRRDRRAAGGERRKKLPLCVCFE